ncbi:MAG: DUF362 domain-containing protein [Bacteroidales bacterium]|nr:DUF362 domain-containing protein [Bacteroidales bacterium]MCF8404574.1 DUF362 domain-containing protein [Bacteroidales bacterium]
MTKESNSRRSFLKQVTAGTAGLGLLNNFSNLSASPNQNPPVVKSKVILVRHKSVIDDDGRTNPQIIQEMLDAGMKALTNKKTTTDAWSVFFNKEDKVGLKINSLGLTDLQGTGYVEHFKGMSNAIVSGLKSLEMDEKNILIWDRSDEELENAGYTIQKDVNQLRIIGTRVARRGDPEGFNPESFPVGDNTTRVHSFITDACTSYINIPVMKTHRIAGITGSLKNHYGSIDNPREFHQYNATKPGIPEINAIPVIREKQKLIIADALLGVIDGGPGWSLDKIFTFGGILLGTDPVAIDSIMLDILNKKRIEEEYDPIDTAIHLELSEAEGLGNHKMENIDLIEINLG